MGRPVSIVGIFLSAICITAQMPVQDRVELICESAAGDLASETAMPLVLIAKELIANAAKHGLGGRAKMVVRVALRKESNGYIFKVEDDGPGSRCRPRIHAHLGYVW